MFDFAWSEIALIAAVALIVIGPKDMPVAIRAATGWIKKARRMAAEFQTHVDEMVREANLDEVRSQINEIRNFDIRKEIERNVDPDGSLRSTFASNPLDPQPIITPPPAVEEVAVAEAPVTELHKPEPEPEPAEPEIRRPEAPAFIPPGMVPLGEPEAQEPPPPAFIPPEVVLQRRSRPTA
ncbi:MAG: twin-arginine translocase subunit TatB [Acetobacteraceae bacterium]|nr:twin-arginine translocase subunit TatB [Acetobacteraceae bacterium]